MTVITVKGKGRLMKQLKAVNPAIHAAVKVEMAKIITEMDTEIKSGIASGVRSGRQYNRGKKIHIASAPGELPKTDRGRLIAGFFFDVKVTSNRILGRLFNKAKHAAALEFKPISEGGRPFMRPLYDKWEQPAQERLTKAMNKALKTIGRGK